MTKVYVVQANYDYEGSCIESVFSSVEKAEAEAERLNLGLAGRWSMDYSVEEWEVRDD